MARHSHRAYHRRPRLRYRYHLGCWRTTERKLRGQTAQPFFRWVWARNARLIPSPWLECCRYSVMKMCRFCVGKKSHLVAAQDCRSATCQTTWKRPTLRSQKRCADGIHRPLPDDTTGAAREKLSERNEESDELSQAFCPCFAEDLTMYQYVSYFLERCKQVGLVLCI